MITFAIVILILGAILLVIALPRDEEPSVPIMGAQIRLPEVTGPIKIPIGFFGFGLIVFGLWLGVKLVSKELDTPVKPAVMTGVNSGEPVVVKSSPLIQTATFTPVPILPSPTFTPTPTTLPTDTPTPTVTPAPSPSAVVCILGSGFSGNVKEAATVGMVKTYSHCPPVSSIQYDDVSFDDDLSKVELVCSDYTTDITEYFSYVAIAGEILPHYRSDPINIPSGCRVDFTVKDNLGGNIAMSFRATGVP